MYASGQVITENDSIKLKSNSSERILFSVKLTRPSNLVVNGNNKIFRKSNSSGFPVQIGTSQYLDDLAWFTNYSSSYDIELFGGDFGSSGGIFYVEFETSSGLKYTSQQKQVKVEGTSSGGGGSGTSIVLSNFIIKNIRYENAIAVTNNTIDIPFQGTSAVTIDYEAYVQSGNGCDFKVNLVYNNGGSTNTIMSSDTFQNCVEQGELLQFELNYVLSDFLLNDTSRIQVVILPLNGGGAKVTNFVDIEISDIFSIAGNFVSGSQSVNFGESPFQIAATSPSNSNGRENSYDGSFTYQWQKLDSVGKWTNIANQTNSQYNISPLYELIFIRRVASSFGIVNASNFIEIEVLTVTNGNKICCDQIVSNGLPAIINGSTPGLSEGYTYQWQIKPRSIWTNIQGATNKNYTPPVPSSRPGRSATVLYRRLVQTSTDTISSNQVSIQKTSDYSSSRISNAKKETDSRIIEVVEENSFEIFPIPSHAIVKVSSNNYFSTYNIILETLNGRTLKVYKNIIQNSYELNIEDLPDGIYIIRIINSQKEIILNNKIIKY